MPNAPPCPCALLSCRPLAFFFPGGEADCREAGESRWPVARSVALSRTRSDVFPGRKGGGGSREAPFPSPAGPVLAPALAQGSPRLRAGGGTPRAPPPRPIRKRPASQPAGACAGRSSLLSQDRGPRGPGHRWRAAPSSAARLIDEAFRVASERAPGGPALLRGFSVMGKPRWGGSGARAGRSPFPIRFPSQARCRSSCCRGGRLYRPQLCDGRVAPRAFRCPQNHARLPVLAPVRVERPVGAGREQRRAVVRLELSRARRRGRDARERERSEREGEKERTVMGRGRGNRARSARSFAVPPPAAERAAPAQRGPRCPGRARLVGSLSPLARPVISARPGGGTRRAGFAP